MNAARLLQLAALERRLASQPPAVQALLRVRAEAARAACTAAPGEPAPADPQAPAPRPSATSHAVAWPRPVHTTDELASVARFRRALARTRARDSVQRATAQRPANAGPLNSQALVLESLALMQSLPGDYMRHFVAHVESLMWLEAAGTPAAPAPQRKTRRRVL